MGTGIERRAQLHSMTLLELQLDRFMPFPVREFDYRGKWLKFANLATINRLLKSSLKKTTM
jgi:hypothetical protein